MLTWLPYHQLTHIAIDNILLEPSHNSTKTPFINFFLHSSKNLNSTVSHRMTVLANDADLWSFMPSPLEEYDVNTVSAFMPQVAPLEVLSDPYYDPWEKLISNLVPYQMTGTFREKVRQLPLLKTDKLTNLREYQRAFKILVFICHGFVWTLRQRPEEEIPECLAVPLCELSDYLEICPVLTNIAGVLWNWRYLDISVKEFNLENISTHFTFTGTTDENWFWLLSAFIEYSGGGIIKYSGATNSAALNNDIDGVLAGLNGLAKSIKKLIPLITRMIERCDPYVFYWKLRPYLAGSENMEAVGIPNGFCYNGCDHLAGTNTENAFVNKNNKIYRKYAGASAAQSSIIQAIDIALGIKHYVTEDDFVEKTSNLKIDIEKVPKFAKPPGNPLLLKMRDYMPGKHRRFLVDFEKSCKIREFVLLNTQDVAQPSATEFSELISYKENVSSSLSTHHTYSTKEQLELLGAYNKCVSTLKSFRDAHIKMVKDYIIHPIKSFGGSPASTPKSTPAPSKTSSSRSSQNLDNGIYDHGLAKAVVENEAALGTGGTDALSFLGQLKDETKASRIGT